MSRHIINPTHDPLGSLFEEILSPFKYGPRMYDHVGTKDNPTIITRSHVMERKYKRWREDDGSYHEELIDADDLSDLPMRPGRDIPEITD